MAKPDTDEEPGFNKVWRDLDRALSMPVFTKHENSLMQVARELSYTSSVIDGTKRARPFRFHIARLAERRGLTRECLSRALGELLKDNVLTGTRDRLKINKDYRRWKGSHALSKDQIRECESALNHPITDCGETLSLGQEVAEDDDLDTDVHRDEKVTGVTKKSQAGVGGTGESEPGVTEKSRCDEKVTDSVTKKSQCDEKVTPSSDDAVTKKSHQRDEKVTLSPSPLASPLVGREQSIPVPPKPPTGVGVVGSDLDFDPDSEPFEAGVRNQPLPEAVPTKHDFDPKRFKQLADKADKFFPLMDYGTKVYALRGEYLAEHIDYALEELHGSGHRGWKYFLGILRRVEATGIPVPNSKATGTSGRPERQCDEVVQPSNGPSLKFRKFSR